MNRIHIYWDSTVGIGLATGWMVAGSNLGGGEIFRTLGPTQPPIQLVPGLSRG